MADPTRKDALDREAFAYIQLGNLVQRPRPEKKSEAVAMARARRFLRVSDLMSFDNAALYESDKERKRSWEKDDGNAVLLVSGFAERFLALRARTDQATKFEAECVGLVVEAADIFFLCGCRLVELLRSREQQVVRLVVGRRQGLEAQALGQAGEHGDGGEGAGDGGIAAAMAGVDRAPALDMSDEYAPAGGEVPARSPPEGPLVQEMRVAGIGDDEVVLRRPLPLEEIRDGEFEVGRGVLASGDSDHAWGDVQRQDLSRGADAPQQGLDQDAGPAPDIERRKA